MPGPLFADAGDDPRPAEAEALLRRYLRDDILDEVIHRPAPALHGETLDEFARRDPGELLAQVRTMLNLRRLDHP